MDTTENTQKTTCDQIVEKAKEINPATVAVEIFQWLAKSVTSYIDNHETEFCCYVYPSADEDQAVAMPECKKLQDLYLSIPAVPDRGGAELSPEEEVSMDVYDFINEKVADKVKDLMVSKDDPAVKAAAAQLFSAMIFYYEMVGFKKVMAEKDPKKVLSVNPVIRELDGYVQVNNLFYDPISMDVEVHKKMKKKLADGSLVDVEDNDDKVVKTINVPEAFVIEFAIQYWQKTSVIPSM